MKNKIEDKELIKDIKAGTGLNKESLRLLESRYGEREKEWIKQKEMESWDDIMRDPISMLLSLPFLPILYFEKQIAKHYVKRSNAEWHRKIYVNQYNASDPEKKSEYDDSIIRCDQKIEQSRSEVKSLEIKSLASLFAIIGFISTVWMFALAMDPLLVLAITASATAGAALVGASIGLGSGYLRNREIDTFAYENGQQAVSKLIDEMINQQHDKKNQQYNDVQLDVDIGEVKRKVNKEAHKYGLTNLTVDNIGKNPDLKSHIDNLAKLTGKNISDLILDLDKEYKEYKNAKTK